MTMYARSAVTIAAIMDAAAQLFTTRNYADVTMVDIAEAAEVTKGALYHHFSGKEELYLRMMHDYLAGVGELLTGVVAATKGQPARDRLHAFTLTFLRQEPIKRELMHLVRRDINIFRSPEREDLIHAYQRALPEQAEAILRDGIAAGEIVAEDPRLLSWQHVAGVEVVLRPYAASILGRPERIADYVIGLYFDGVAQRRDHDH